MTGEEGVGVAETHGCVRVTAKERLNEKNKRKRGVTSTKG